MDRLDLIKNAIDETIHRSQTKYLSLRAANKLLWDKSLISEFERDRGYLKSLLEQKSLNALQTESQPRQWRIYPTNSSSDFFNLEKEKKSQVQSRPQKEKKKYKDVKKGRRKVDPYLILGILGIVALIFFGIRSHGIIEEQNAPYKINPSGIDAREAAVPSQEKEISSPIQPIKKSPTLPSSSSKNVHTLKSTLHDKERNGEILQTSSEIMYHTIDLNKLTVTHRFQVDGSWKEIVYPFSEYYKEEGNFYTTMVLKVGVKGVKEIWWTPEVNNLGYDFYDGNRLVSYDLERVSN